MRTATEVGKRALSVSGDMTVFKFAYKLALVGLASVTEHAECILLGNISADDILFPGYEFHHLLLDFREIIGSNLMLAGSDIVIEPVFDCGTDTEFHPGIKLLKCLGKKMG